MSSGPDPGFGKGARCEKDAQFCPKHYYVARQGRASLGVV